MTSEYPSVIDTQNEVTGGPLPDVSASDDGVGGGTGMVQGRAAARRRRRRRALLEWVIVLVVALGVAVVMRTFVVQTFYIPSGSMEPTLNIGDRILVDKLSYHLHPVHRGDIVVFAKPPNEQLEPGINDLVKRVIGLPGESISGANGQVYINGKPLAEPWLPKGVVTSNFGPIKIPKNDYFVMGDNRGFSEDSRVFGPISGSLIVGRVVFRIWPLSHITLF
jgi:signal peptidase I